jgi:hypothetical protein
VEFGYIVARQTIDIAAAYLRLYLANEHKMKEHPPLNNLDHALNTVTQDFVWFCLHPLQITW